MDKIMKNKRGLEMMTSRSSGYKQAEKNSFISYVLPDQVWLYSIKQFLGYSKNFIC